MTSRESSSVATRSWLPAVDPRQLIKVLVYGLLLVNFFHYFLNDLNVARHTVHAGWGLVDWTKAFATTLDESAWFVLLFLLELETYLLSDDAFTRGRVLALQGLRLLCYLFIAHTVFAFGDYLADLRSATAVVDTSLCSLSDSGLSFARNLSYRELNSDNCHWLSQSDQFFIFAQGQLVSDRAGMRVEWTLAWIDLLEVLVWLLILAMIELMVRLQEKGITEGALLRFARTLKWGLFALLWVAAGCWAYLGHWMFVWDEALWILGFAAIGMNLSDWRQEIDADNAAALRR